MLSGKDSLPRGAVVRVRLNPIEGSEQSGERPALIVSPDFINERSPVVIVAAITSRKTDLVYPTEVLIEPSDGGLPLLSKVMLHLRSQVNEALKIATGLVQV